jgi:hypothetical protein
LVVAAFPRREDGTDVERPESAGAEGAERIKSGDDCVGILKDQATGRRKSEDGAERAVDCLDFYAAGTREGLCGLEREGEGGRERKVIGAGERYGGRRGELRTLTEKRDGGTRRRDGDGDGEGTAVVESNIRGEMIADLGRRHGSVGRQRQAKGVGGFRGLRWITGGRRQWTEGEIAEGEALDLVETEACKEDGAIGGV